ncbi:ABC transporter permease [Pseudoxanthomonas suwonensis]|uniref:Lipid kinase n=1 Tax=Pseudoxanthomonas suwonensis TaxID=314722 RepID=A0A0E3Z2V1_9GAMM|nr:ABC transporter permease [Pseudoxanthomonas suwonensis]AKC86408.1 lipid kinase [Pseudoxanthomonas suwonensis]
MRRLINLAPGRNTRWLLALLPLMLIALVYLSASAQRHAANPADKLLPTPAAMADAFHRAAVEPDRRSGARIFWTDTAASLKRLGTGLGVSAVLALSIGLVLGLLPLARATMAPTVAVLALVPPMAILPILFIVFGLGELSKVMLIIIGVTPGMARDLALKVGQLPREQIVKAQTLGAGTWQLLLRVALPQALPQLVIALRLALGTAFLFLIAAEAISAESGLGYRIFLVRRYLAMDLILPYVAWITLLAFAFDLALRQCSRWAFPWFHQGRDEM